MNSQNALPKVSVVSVFYNRANCVDLSVESLLAQDYENLEIILVDDGSSDETLERLRKFEERGCRVVSHENKGFVRALRDAIANASGHFIAIHGSGDVSYPSRIRIQAQHLVAHPDVVAVSCGSRYLNTVTGSEVVKCSQRTVVYSGLRSLRGRSPLVHGQAMFRRADYDIVGGYRTFFVNAQDHDLWLRLIHRGSFAVLPTVLYDNYSRSDGISQSPYKWALQKAYGQIAVDCSEQRERFGKDDVDMFGAGAALIRRRSSRLARLFAIRGIRSLAINDVVAAQRLYTFASRERALSPTVAILKLLLGMEAQWSGSGPTMAEWGLRLSRRFSQPGAHW